jgi:TolB-like protein
MSFIAELKRRNVLRVGAAYVVTAWLVIQVVETILPAFGFGDAAVRLVTSLFAIGFIPVLIFAWIFELTPEGIRKEREIELGQSIAPQTATKLDRTIMVLLTLALGYFAFDKFVMAPQREDVKSKNLATQVEKALRAGRTEAMVSSYGDKSIAVLPFVNMSDDASNEYFSEGISEELLNLLAKIPDLRVVSRSSSFSYKGKEAKLAQIAEELNVAHILEGSVRKVGNQVRISAQLIDAQSDTQLWSEAYSRTLDDVFAIQDEIAATVAEQMRVTLLDDAPQVEQTDPEAHALYLQARFLGNQGSIDDIAEAADLLREALVIDPDYAGAWRALAVVYINEDRGDLRPPEEAYRLARDAAQKALDIDPDFAKAYDTLGWIAMEYDDDLVQAARYYQRALELAPADGTIIGNATALLIALGRVSEAIELGKYTLIRDPVSPISHSNLGITYRYAARMDEAVEAFQATLRLSPGRLGAHFNLGLALLLRGEAEAALAQFSRERVESLRAQGTVLAHHDLGHQAEYEASLDELIKGWGDEDPSAVASVYAYAGDADAAFQWLEKSSAEQPAGLAVLDPLLNSLHQDSRWLSFLESIGKSPAQLGAIEFEITLPDLKSQIDATARS